MLEKVTADRVVLVCRLIGDPEIHPTELEETIWLSGRAEE